MKPILQLADDNSFVPIETTQWKNGNLIGASFNHFDYAANPSTEVYLKKTLSINLSQPSNVFSAAVVSGNGISKDSRYTEETELRFEKGNLVQVIKKDGLINTFIWGYDNSLPVAKVIGASYNPVSSILYQPILDNPSTDQALRDELQKIRQLADVQVVTYTYSNLVGITSETDALDEFMSFSCLC